MDETLFDKSRRTTLKRAEEAAIAKIVLAHCSVKEGYAVYEEGWNDDRVLRECGIARANRGELAEALK